MTTSPEMRGAVLEVDLDAIAANWHFLKSLHSSGPTAAVVKADGYGLGAAEISSRLYREGCRHVFVAHLEEALAIRDGVPDAMLSVLNGLIPGTEAAHAAHGIVPVLGSLDEVRRWAALAVETRSRNCRRCCTSTPGWRDWASIRGNSTRSPASPGGWRASPSAL